MKSMILILLYNHLLRRKLFLKRTNFITKKIKMKNKKKIEKDSKGRSSFRKDKHKFGQRKNLSPKNNPKIILIALLHL